MRPDPDKAAIRAEAARLQAAFVAAGAVAVDADILLPAETLLDLYGEDIRARAFTTSDPLRGEMMLRPDFTVPVVQAHMAGGAEPARYTYAGEVFRRQETDEGRATEYLQVGYELFDRTDPAAADAEVFALFAGLLAPLGLKGAIGDMGLLRAAVLGLVTSDRRKAALLRHLWRPRRFRALVERYSNPARPRPALAAADPFAEAGPEIGLRSRAEVEARIAALAADAAEPRLSAAEADLLERLAGLEGPAPALEPELRTIARELAGLGPAVDVYAARLDALAVRGIDVGELEAQASYGRTTLEYYDGFVFGFYAPGRTDLPPIATGGRYDALTRALGGGAGIPAIGGVIRPSLTLALGGRP